MTQSNSYEKYRWFFTSGGKLVIGGKSAEQNETLVKEIIKLGLNYVVMHTSEPGSPFTFMVDEGIDDSDLHEQAVFTASFSQQWKKGKKTAPIDIFSSKQVTKNNGMKEGTFGVLGKVAARNAELKLGFEIQEGKLRCVPNPDEKTTCIKPGKETKTKIAKESKKYFKVRNIELSMEDIERAMPLEEARYVLGISYYSAWKVRIW